MISRRVYLFAILPTDDLQPTFFETGDLAEDIKHSLVPTRRVERYTRTWRISKPVETHGGRVIGGKLGFDESSQRQAITYDETEHDFVPGSQVSRVGKFIHYAVHCDLRYMAAEVRPPDIRPNSVKGAMQEFMQTGSHPLNLKVDSVYDARGLSTWIREVDRVSSFVANMERANPKYKNKSIEELFEKSGAEEVDVSARASQDSSLDIVDSPLHLYAEYAEDGHGHVDAQGMISANASIYLSGRRAVSENLVIEEDADIKTVVGQLGSWINSILSRLS
ncbi:MAG: hypothetical protein OXG65_09480 [Chloroflexi bacterium]|nr:hypothetical protein [Chloroflexota bacterium]